MSSPAQVPALLTLESALERLLEGRASSGDKENLEQHFQQTVEALSQPDLSPDTLALLAPSVETPPVKGSHFELVWLYALATQKKQPLAEIPNSSAMRGGYLVYSDLKQQRACVFPLLSALLSQAHRGDVDAWARLKQDCKDVWSVDLSVWEAIEAKNAPAAALAWLKSPGRKLLHGLESLRELLSSPRMFHQRPELLAASGWNTLPSSRSPAHIDQWWDSWVHRHPRWLELHSAIPGFPLEVLSFRCPKPEDVAADQVPRWIDQLSTGNPATRRGVALLRLLDRAVDAPLYELEGMKRRLNEDLSLHLAGAHQRLTLQGRDPVATLEALSLQVAGQLNPLEPEQEQNAFEMLRTWGLSRWLTRCLSRSPYFGEELEILAVQLEGLLLSQESAEPEKSLVTVRDVLDPLRFGSQRRLTESQGLAVDDVALLNAVVAHYFDLQRKRSEKRLLPMPLSLLERLRAIASREERLAELAAEEVFAREPHRANVLNWRAPHFSPPWLSRWVLTDLGMSWLGTLSVELQLTCIARLKADPRRFVWLANAIHQEHTKLTDTEIQKALYSVWKDFEAEKRTFHEHDLIQRIQLTLTPAVLGQLTAAEQTRVCELLVQLAPMWQPKFYDQLLEASENQRKWEFWDALASLLIATLEQGPGGTREEFPRIALIRIPSSRSPQRLALMEHLLQVLQRPVFAQQPLVARELRRLMIHS